jgi:hypothetical protein
MNRQSGPSSKNDPNEGGTEDHTTYHATIATMTFIANTSVTKKPTSNLAQFAVPPQADLAP